MATGSRSEVAERRASATRLRGIRAALGLSQRDWSYYLRVSVGAVSNWETGRTRPSGLAEQQIRNVAASLGLDLHTLEPFDG